MARPFLYLLDNAGQGMALVDACVRHGVKRFVLSSTANLYGAPEVVPIPDDARLDPSSPYGESKWMIERALRWAGEVHGLRSACLRYFNAAGCDPEGALGEDHSPETHLIPLVIDAALGRRGALQVFGTDWPTADGTAVRDYVHVTDLAAAHLLALERLEGGSLTWNVGTGWGIACWRWCGWWSMWGGVRFRWSLRRGGRGTRRFWWRGRSGSVRRGGCRGMRRWRTSCGRLGIGGWGIRGGMAMDGGEAPIGGEVRRRAVQAAQGGAGFDVLLTGGTVVDVVTGELRVADVGLVGGVIASVHAAGSRGDAGERHDVGGQYLAPGFVDSHVHFESSHMTPTDYAGVVVPQGTTTAVWDPHELANVAGLAGVRWAVEASRGLALRVLVAAPSCVPSAPGLEVGGAEFGPGEMAEMLGWGAVAGVAEVMDMAGVLAGSARMEGIVAAGLAAGKNVNGHARDLAGARLQAYAAAGVTSDHEIMTGEDLLEKLRAGLVVELRGSHDAVLPGAIAAILGLPRMPAGLVACTDDIVPDELVAKGGLRDTLARFVARGLGGGRRDPDGDVECGGAVEAGRYWGGGGGAAGGDRGVVGFGRDGGVAGFMWGGRWWREGGRMCRGVERAVGGALRGTMRMEAVGAEAFRLRVRGVEEGRVRLPAVGGGSGGALGGGGG